MSACQIVITGTQPRCGKTHFGAALARRLARHGHMVEILHLGSPSPFRVVASDGAVISRPAAVLAEAALVESGARHEDRSRLGALAAASEFVLIESAKADISGAAEVLRLSEAEGSYKLDGYGKLPVWRGPAIVPDTPEDVVSMEAWRVGGWPRVGVVTLPNLSNFSDFQIIRGAEWMTFPLPGRFTVLFLPATADPVSDRAWLENQGLAKWLEGQRAEGCRLVSIGWKFPGADLIEPGELSDHVLASRLVERRFDPPLPAEETLDQLAEWLSSWSRCKALIERLESRVVR